MNPLNRRAALIELALLAGAAAMPARAAGEPKRLFAGTKLAGDRVAIGFTAVDIALPKVTLLTATGRQSLAALKGKVRLMTLWSEWCVPCIVEARDMAVLQAKTAGRDFEIVSVLSSSDKPFDFAGARAFLDRNRVGALPLMVEPDGGDVVLRKLSPGRTGLGELPCTLIIDRNARVRGISHGVPVEPMPGSAPGVRRVFTEADKKAILASDRGTLWLQSGEKIIDLLRSGFLDKH